MRPKPILRPVFSLTVQFFNLLSLDAVHMEFKLFVGLFMQDLVPFILVNLDREHDVLWRRTEEELSIMDRTEAQFTNSSFFFYW